MLLSIIIPVYNTAKYLSECLDSCLNQDCSYDDYEIICVDDGSSDNSADILDKYAADYSNIMVVHKENGGVSSARNKGIDISKGEYIWFVDSDDFIEENSVRDICKELKDNKPERLIINAYHMKSDVLSEEEKALKLTNALPSGKKFIWGYILKASVIREKAIRFRENVTIEEDSIFFYEFSANTKIQDYEYDKIVYYYRNNSTSIIHYSEKKHLLSYINIAYIMRDFYNRNYGNIEYAEYSSLLHTCRALAIIVKLPHNERKMYKKMLMEKHLFGYKPSEISKKKFISKNFKSLTLAMFCLSSRKHGYYYAFFIGKYRKIYKLFRR